MKIINYTNLMGDLKHVLDIIKDILQDPQTIVKFERAVTRASQGNESLFYEICFEKLGQIKENPERVDEIIEDIVQENFIWDSCIFDEYEKDEEVDLEEMVKGIKVEKGEFKCRNKKCKSDACYFFTYQTRSRDEGATVYVVCTKCNDRYKFN